jgi:hypothetical protein
MVGGTIGAQIQQGYVVLGLEGDLDWANIKGNGISTPTIGRLGLAQPITLNMDSNISAVGTARARVGVAMNNWLFYGTGGAAFVKSSANGTSIAGVPCLERSESFPIVLLPHGGPAWLLVSVPSGALRRTSLEQKPIKLSHILRQGSSWCIPVA